MSRSRVFEWHKRFKEGREDVEDDPRSGSSPSSREVTKGVRFLDMEAIKKAVTTELKRIPEESFQSAWTHGRTE